MDEAESARVGSTSRAHACPDIVIAFGMNCIAGACFCTASSSAGSVHVTPLLPNPILPDEPNFRHRHTYGVHTHTHTYICLCIHIYRLPSRPNPPCPSRPHHRLRATSCPSPPRLCFFDNDPLPHNQPPFWGTKVLSLRGFTRGETKKGGRG